MRVGVVVPRFGVVGDRTMPGALTVVIVRKAGPVFGMGSRMVQTYPHPEGVGGSEAQEEEPTQEGEYGMPK